MKLLVIDIGAGRVTLGSEELRNQWIDFYALLALTRDGASSGDAFVTAETLGRVGPWRHKAIASVGKEVARHLRWLNERGLGDLVANDGKTRSWRLTIPRDAIDFLPNRESVQTWIESRSASTASGSEFINNLRRLVDASVMLQQGDAESVLDALEEPLAGNTESTLEAWAALLQGRAAYQHGDYDLLVSLHDDWLKRADGPGRAVGARLRALIAYRNRFEDTSSMLSSLSRLAGELELRGDVGALGSVLNVMGLLTKRLGDPVTAAAHHLRAAGLLGVVSDYPSLQGALFNLANCRRQILRQEGRPADGAVFELIDLCQAVCRHFGVGGDSAQAEIAAAQWACESGDAERARRYLKDAEELVKRIETSFDQACFLLARAQIEHAFPDGTSNPVHDLRTAERIFMEVGEEQALEKTRRLLRSFTSEAGRER